MFPLTSPQPNPPTLTYCMSVISLYLLSLALWQKAQMAKRSLKQALIDAQKSAKAKSDFHSQLSHELRTPLNSIIGWTELVVEQGGLPDETKRMLDMALFSGQTLRQIIDDILDFNRLAEGTLELHDQVFDLFRLTKHSTAMHVAAAGRKGL
ncbi:hypothetical protein HK104_007247, partial [Borealophlyctis nickersoniae]